jgi:phosphoglycolate phosphatase
MSDSNPLLVFDLDGTLADTADDLIETLNFILEREGLPPVASDEARKMVGLGARTLLRRGFAADGRTLEDERLELLFYDYLAHYEAHIAVHTRLYPGVLEALDRFEQAGFSFAVCTNKTTRPARDLLEALRIAGRFRAICGQDAFDWSKPDPRALLSTIVMAGGQAEASIMVGDSRTDIATAQAAHVPVVAVDFGYTDVPVRELSPDRVISHFDELWEAVASLAPRA